MRYRIWAPQAHFMAGKKSLNGQLHREPVKKRTSIGHGMRKSSSFKTHGEKKYRGQGK